MSQNPAQGTKQPAVWVASPPWVGEGGLGSVYSPFVSSAAPAQQQKLPTHVVQFCNWTSPTYGSQGEMAWNTAFKVAELTIALANSIAQQEIADKQMDLAEKWYDHQQYKWDRWRDNFFPLEQKLVKEVTSVKIPELDCDNAMTRAEEQTRLSGPMVDDWMKGQFKKYRICARGNSLNRVALQNAVVTVDCYNYNLADEEWFRTVKEDQRWNNRSNVANLGRNMDSQAQAYGDFANKLYSQVGKQLDRFGSAAMTALGYFGTRNEGFIPMSYLSTGGQSDRILSAIHQPGNALGTQVLNPAPNTTPGGLGG